MSDSKKAKPPLECAWCGMPLWNDLTVSWLPLYDSQGERRPYCRDQCADDWARQEGLL